VHFGTLGALGQEYAGGPGVSGCVQALSGAFV
jgi:hypothetical protein